MLSTFNSYAPLFVGAFCNSNKANKRKKYGHVSDSAVSKSSNDNSKTLASDCAGNNTLLLDCGNQKKMTYSTKPIKENSIKEVNSTKIFPKIAKLPHSNERDKIKVGYLHALLLPNCCINFTLNS